MISRFKCTARMLVMFLLGSIIAGSIVFLRVNDYVMKTQREIKAKMEIIRQNKEAMDKEVAEAIGSLNLLEYERRRLTNVDLMNFNPSDTLRKSRAKLMTLKRLRGLSDKD